MGRCLKHETTLDRLRAKATLTEEELNKLKSWKVVQEKILALSEEVRGELEKQTELLKKALADKDKEIKDANDRLHQAKEEAIHKYRDSDALLAELGGSFAKGFNDCLHQVKASYPDLDLSSVNIDAPAPTSVQPILSESTDELFADDVPGSGEKDQVEDTTITLPCKRRTSRIPLFSSSFLFFVNILVERC